MKTPAHPLRLLALALLGATPLAAQSLVPRDTPTTPHTSTQVAPHPPHVPHPPAAPGQRAPLATGDKAPALPPLTWLRGEPVTAFQPGTTYVLEFWAPWCPFCREALPTYAGIARTWSERNVRVLGISVWPRKSAPDMARDFVADQEELFPYPVAEDVDGAAAKAFLQAADCLIPSAMIVDGEGRLAWIGNPGTGLEKELTRLVGMPTGLGAQLAIRRGVYKSEMEEARAAHKARDWARLAELSRKLYEQDPEGLADFAVDHYVALVMLGQKDTARALGERLLNVDFAGEPSGLNALAWFIVEPGGVIPEAQRDLDLALRAAARANDLTGGKDPWILDTLACVHFVRGQLGEALRQQLKAVAAAEKETGPRAPYLRRDLSQRLAEYQAAAEAAESAEQDHGQIP
ncbi:MAG: TlpA family protein disulfide reductase [Planctomycetes bacterium]|nr:TlpA family protein disulfide reductase [Planctomycetota bacterium]